MERVKFGMILIIGYRVVHPTHQPDETIPTQPGIYINLFYYPYFTLIYIDILRISFDEFINFGI